VGSVYSLASSGMINTVLFHREWSLSWDLRCLVSCRRMWKVLTRLLFC